jgi:two-component system C4-dicarboxylate transport sensor histidine kinase DctB
MDRAMLHRGLIILGFLLAVAALTAGVWRYGLGQALGQLSQRAASDLALASDRLSTQLQRYQEMAVLLADHPALAMLETPAERTDASLLLLAAADKTGALDIAYADRGGAVLASAHGLMGTSVAQTPAFRRAMQGALGSLHGRLGSLDQRAYFFAAPAFDVTGPVRGVLVVAVDLNAVEQAWRGSSPAVYFTDADGTVFISNRTDLLNWTQRADGAGLRPAQGEERPFAVRRVAGHEIWQIDWGRYLPARALHLTKPMPWIGLTGEVLVDIEPARRLAALQAAVVAAVCLAFGALLFLATERRRTLARANAVLESRVAERTRELQDANTALTRAQAELVQAGKLSALGQMSAGISHELNQPLMAIRSFAENGAQFLHKGQADRAADNLSRISALAHRMGRIIQNLRAFARQETQEVGRVDIIATLDAAFDLTADRLAQDGVTLTRDLPPGPVWIRGGDVRLGQVFVNLITNAADAMADSAERRIDLELRDHGDAVLITLRDTGPGIAEPDKLFEPFYTTKEVGASEGMGLGLSISYGLVKSCGGAIRGRNHPDGGAVFSVELARWAEAPGLEAAE